jgi:hypothetical protein
MYIMFSTQVGMLLIINFKNYNKHYIIEKQSYFL